MTKSDDQAGVRFPPPLVFIGFLTIGLLVDTLTGRVSFGAPEGPRWVAALALLVVGAAIVIAALIGFRRAGTRPEPWETSTTIVDKGVYATSRNPMYVAMAMLHLGMALATDSVWSAAMLLPAIYAIQTHVIRPEEAYLTTKFGRTYLDYQRRVRRWL